jgi:hypothetical protein
VDDDEEEGGVEGAEAEVTETEVTSAEESRERHTD